RDRVGARARPSLTRVGLRAGATVAARCPVGSVRIRAGAGRRVARAGDMTLIARRTRDRVGARARPGLTPVRLSACVAVVAGHRVVAVMASRGGIARVVGAEIAVIAVQWRTANARTVAACVRYRAGAT